MRAKEFIVNVTVPVNIKINGDGDPEITTDQDTPVDELGDMVPPLQQKLELMKKSVGVDNIYDEEETDQQDDAISPMNPPFVDDDPIDS